MTENSEPGDKLRAAIELANRVRALDSKVRLYVAEGRQFISGSVDAADWIRLQALAEKVIEEAG